MNREEDRVQQAIFDYICTVAPDIIIFAVPNASARLPSGRPANLVAGLVPGVFDLCMSLPDQRIAFLEVKTAKGTLSSAQEQFKLRLIKAGIPYAVVRSIDDVRIALDRWGVVTKEHKHA